MLAALGKKLINANITITIYRTYFKVVQRNFFFLENRGIYYLKKYLNLAKTGKKNSWVMFNLRNGFTDEYIQLPAIYKLILFW